MKWCMQRVKHSSRLISTAVIMVAESKGDPQNAYTLGKRTDCFSGHIRFLLIKHRCIALSGSGKCWMCPDWRWCWKVSQKAILLFEDLVDKRGFRGLFWPKFREALSFLFQAVKWEDLFKSRWAKNLKLWETGIKRKTFNLDSTWEWLNIPWVGFSALLQGGSFSGTISNIQAEQEINTSLGPSPNTVWVNKWTNGKQWKVRIRTKFLQGFGAWQRWLLKWTS